MTMILIIKIQIFQEMSYTIEVIDGKTSKKITTLERIPNTATIGDVKERFEKHYSVFYKGVFYMGVHSEI